MVQEATVLSKMAVQDPIAGAGIMPFCLRNGRVHVLIGVDTDTPDVHGQRWSALEGRNNDGESDEETAAREFDEESMGIMTSREVVLQWLRAGEFEQKHEFRTHKRRRVLYTKQVEHDAHLVNRFKDRRNQLLRLRRRYSDLVHEYTNIRREAGAAGTKWGHDEIMTSRSDGSWVRLVYSVHSGRESRRCEAVSNMSERLRLWLTHWRGYLAMWRDAEWTDAALVVSDTFEDASVVRHVSFREEYFEKSEIGWWSSQQLRHAFRWKRSRSQFTSRATRSMVTVLDELDAKFDQSSVDTEWRTPTSGWSRRVMQRVIRVSPRLAWPRNNHLRQRD